MNMSSRNRIASYIIKIMVIVCSAPGVFLSAYVGRNSFMGGNRVFMYFTIQSNIAVGLISLAGLIMMIQKKEFKTWWYVLQLVGAVAITLTGIVFCFVLAPTMGKYAWNVLTHVIVPLAAVADFFVSGIKRIPGHSAAGRLCHICRDRKHHQ